MSKKEIQKSEKKTNEIILKPTEENKVVFPVTPNNFKDFIIGLLGQPRTISRTYFGTFSISFEDLKNFHFFLNRRLFQQNDFDLSQIIIVVNFNDNSSVTVKTFDELQLVYEELGSLVSTSITILWQFLVKFPDRETPEKQEIEVTVIASGGKQKEFLDRPQRYLSHDKVLHYGGQINYTVSYTALSWGHDIENLLARHIEPHIEKASKFRKWLGRNDNRISLMVGSIFFISFLIGSYFRNNNFKSKFLETLKTPPSSLGDKLTSMTENIWSGGIIEHYYYSAIFTFIVLILSFFLASFISTKSHLANYSYLLLTKESFKNKENKDKIVKRDWRQYIISLGLGIIGSLIASYIWSKL